MAKPILEMPVRDPRVELQARLDRAPVEHAEALLAAYEVLQALHDQGAFDLLRGALGASDNIIEIVTEAARKPESIGSLRNLLLLAKALGGIDPEALKELSRALPEVVAQAALARRQPPPSLWQSFKLLRGENLRRGLALADRVLEVLTRRTP